MVATPVCRGCSHRTGERHGAGCQVKRVTRRSFVEEADCWDTSGATVDHVVVDEAAAIFADWPHIPGSRRPAGCVCGIEASITRAARERGEEIFGRTLTSDDHRLVRKPVAGCPVHDG